MVLFCIIFFLDPTALIKTATIDAVLTHLPAALWDSHDVEGRDRCCFKVLSGICAVYCDFPNVSFFLVKFLLDYIELTVLFPCLRVWLNIR